MRWLAALLIFTSCDAWVEDLPDAPFEAVEAIEDAGVSAAGDGGAPDAGLGAVDGGADTLDAGRDAPDAGPGALDASVELATVEVLIAQGRLGRTTVSCDDGRTWVEDRDEANGAVCGDAPLVDCWHDQWSSMGLVASGDGVLASWGWGAIPGRVRRTLDGVTWVDVTTNTRFGAITAGGGTAIGATSPVQVSHADGSPGTWAAGGALMSGSVTRLATFVPAGAGRFVIALDGALHASDDRGASWFVLPVPTECTTPPAMSLLAAGATLVVVHWTGTVCTSSDRGQTWSLRPVASGFSSRGVFAQGAFFLWNGATRYRSTDGVTWASAASSPGDVSIGPVAVTSHGTFVAFKGGSQSDYQHERAYRSVDGLTWTPAPSAHSHPITHLVAARVRASAVCPGP